MSRAERIAVYTTVFLSGALLMALEVVAFKIIGKTFGSALRETTAVIAVFLTAMSLGYWLGGRIGDRYPHSRTLVAVLLGTAAMLVGIPWLDAAISPRVAASNLERATHAFVATSLLFALPTVLFASISPMAVRLFATSTGKSGSTAGSISAVSTVGSIAGSVITAFLLIDWLQSIARTVLSVAVATAITALLLFAASMPRRRPFVIAAVAIAIAVIPFVLFLRSTQLDQSLLTTQPGWRTLYVGDSPYHRVTVREKAGRFRTLQFSLGTQSLMWLRDPFGPGAGYTDSMHLGRFLRPNVRRVLLVGLGGGTAAKQFLQYYPDATVDVVEIDPVVVDVAKKYFALPSSDRLRIHVVDGRIFLKRSQETWDLIVIDAYTTSRYGDTIPSHLTTREFFREAAQRLSPGGVLHYHCAFNKSKLLPALQKTIASVFRSTYVTDGEILASDAPFVAPRETVAERARGTRAEKLPNFARFAASLQPYAPVDPTIPLLTDDYAPVDTLR